jgi:hypothetical protein
MAGFAVDLDALRRAAADLRTSTDELDDAVTGFTDQLGGVGDPWGTDLLGTLIGGGYVAIEQLALETLDSIIAAFDGYADGLDRMADTYQQAEDDSETGFGRLGGQGPPWA